MMDDLIIKICLYLRYLKDYRIKFATERVENERTENFRKAFLNNDMKPLYNDLVSGLDKESIKTVKRIFKGFKLLNKNPKAEYLDIYSLKQKQALRDIRFEINKRVKQINESCWRWKNYYLPAPRFIDNVFFFNYQIDKLENHNKFLNKNILDVGGFIGDSAIFFAGYTNKNVHVFEPVKEHYDLMLKTIELNNSKNIIPHNFGLGNKEESVRINLEGGSSSIALPQCTKETCDSEIVKTVSLDEYIKENPMDIGLIKVDVEGYEQQFLRGAKNTICEQKPSLLISIYHSFDDFFKIKPMIESWNLGYKFKISRPDDAHFYNETLLIAEVED